MKRKVIESYATVIGVAFASACGQSSGNLEESRSAVASVTASGAGPTVGSGASGGEGCHDLMLASVDPVEPCQGIPFGAWRLVEFELGTGFLMVTLNGATSRCDAVNRNTEGIIPRTLISLEEGGRARYMMDAVTTLLEWRDSCVTGVAPTLGCEAPDVERTNLRLCNLNCGICSCESTWGDHIDENGSWAVTASALTLELTGKATDFAYCVEGNTLNVSAIDVRMTFERVYLSSNPMACAGRGPAECTAGSGCTSGVCVGGPECLATSEGSCLTNPGCSWDSAACTGEAQAGCALGDYGVVPGCELLDNPPG